MERTHILLTCLLLFLHADKNEGEGANEEKKRGIEVGQFYNGTEQTRK
jgi:hypothetical protein